MGYAWHPHSCNKIASCRGAPQRYVSLIPKKHNQYSRRFKGAIPQFLGQIGKRNTGGFFTISLFPRKKWSIVEGRHCMRERDLLVGSYFRLFQVVVFYMNGTMQNLCIHCISLAEATTWSHPGTGGLKNHSMQNGWFGRAFH